MENTIQFRVTQSVGNSCLSMRTILSDKYFDSIQEAIKTIPPKNNTIDVNIPYWALTKVENGCVHSCISFHQ
jgi:hypothetical protein